MGRWNFLTQPFPHLVFENSLHLVRRTRKQNNDVLSPVELSRQPLPGSGSVGVLQNDRSGENVSLLRSIWSHLPAAIRKTFFQSRQNFFVPVQAHSERFGDRLAGEVILGWSQSAAENHDVASKQRVLGRSCKAPQVVPHYTLENYIDAELIELLREVKGISVHPVGGQHLGAYRDDLGIHALAV